MRSDKKKKRPVWLKMIGIVLLLLIIGFGAYAFTVDTMHQPIEREKSEMRQVPVTLEKQQPFSVLMLGVDEREGDRGRSDSLIVLTVNSNTNTTIMLSIPRDTRTEIIGKGREDKINHAYAFGGVEMAMDTVENFLDIPIDYYMQINMESFQDIVNALDGVTVNNDLDFTSDGVHFPKGELLLNGDKALKYARMRYEDPRGDFGRQLRQRQIIQAVIKEGSSFSTLSKFDDIFKALGRNVKTNMTFDEMVDIQKNYKDAGKNIQQMEVNGSGTKIDGIYYYMVPIEEKQKLQQELSNHLEFKQ